ncbi:MAG: hypothetical protein AAF639_24520 [Chloroflexota bacterium]
MISAPPPWTLNGHGYIFTYFFPQKFVEEHGCIPSQFHGEFTGWIGTMMLVDYQTSAVGPYQELLFIPGQFKLGVSQQRLYSITKIYVSTEASVVNGQRNWGIPKELADFEFTDLGGGAEQIRVSIGDMPVGEWTLKTRRIGIPITTSLLPARWRTLAHEREDELYLTIPEATGRLHLANVQQMTINADLFPDVSSLKPLAVVKAENFQMTFPSPVIKEVI